MDPINRLNRLMEALRQRMATGSAKAAGAGANTRRATEPRTPLSASTNRKSVEQLRHDVSVRIRALGAPSPDSARQARRVFLESILAWEFGDQLLLDTQLNRLIEAIQNTFDADPDLNRELNDLIAELARH